MNFTAIINELLLDLKSAFHPTQDYISNFRIRMDRQNPVCLKIDLIKWDRTNGRLTVLDSFTQESPKVKKYCGEDFGKQIELSNELKRHIIVDLKVETLKGLKFHKPIKSQLGEVIMIRPSKWQHIPFEWISYDYFIDQLDSFDYDCKKYLTLELSCQSYKQFRHILQLLQKTLVIWGNELIQMFHHDRLLVSKKEQGNDDRKSIYAYFYNDMENILVHLEHFYPHFLDRKLVVPFNVISSRVKCLKPNAERLISSLVVQEYKYDFLKILSNPLNRICEVSQKNRINYHQLMFAEIYL